MFCFVLLRIQLKRTSWAGGVSRDGRRRGIRTYMLVKTNMYRYIARPFQLFAHQPRRKKRQASHTSIYIPGITVRTCRHEYILDYTHPHPYIYILLVYIIRTIYIYIYIYDGVCTWYVHAAQEYIPTTYLYFEHQCHRDV